MVLIWTHAAKYLNKGSMDMIAWDLRKKILIWFMILKYIII